MFSKVVKKSNLEKVPESEDLETLLPKAEPLQPDRCHKRRISSKHRTLVLSFIFAASISASLLLGFWAGGQWHRNADSFCFRHTSQYSPIQKEAALSYEVVRFNGSLFKENEFRKDAGPEVDAAWQTLGVDYRSIRVPVEEAAQSNILPDQVKINQKYGGGFPANVEGLHQLHCLNLLRQTLHWNFDYYHSRGEGAFANKDYVMKAHVTHCLDIIRQQLMCTIDTGVLGQVWFNPDFPEPYVDFNTRHTCKNFEAVRRWAEERQLPDDTAEDFLEPPKVGDTIYKIIP